MATSADRLGNPLDPTVGYARGTILRGTAEELAKTLLRPESEREICRSRNEGGHPQPRVGVADPPRIRPQSRSNEDAPMPAGSEVSPWPTFS